VLAGDTTMPMTAPVTGLQPSKLPTDIPSAVDMTMPSGPPTSATHFTPIKSFSENSIPSENMSRTTPISANSSNVWTSETEGPGVTGLMRSPPRT